ncbi:Glycosylphosphatidylinositol-mannosyltransferase I, PIG-X/PBN [Parasponia andersonii]|uniref:Glycosylphosphatidylinositol-mannosyltransferase I, PIG-X/PBN n=1 Tax=Parasponia andersonii TaxID=3476 RepID=A0A2P5BHJ4_PARAD|nr:Glycosylphosphatidylinositol-mannosyltransferase I, PIG-X/PBN [Parasponia andersonii]
MERVGLRIWWLLVGTCFVLFPAPAFSTDSDSSSFSTKVGTSDPNIDVKNPYSSSFCTSKYIMKSYYERYEQLNDSNYQDLIEHELPFGSCDIQPDNRNLVPRLLILERKLIGEGSHRHLYSSIRLSIQAKSITEISYNNCGVILIERLPSGVFADPFELQHLLQRGVFNDVAVFGDTNLELPSFLSNRSAVEVHMDISPSILRDRKEIDIKLALPLHARYAHLNESGYSQVMFGVPDLFLRCGVERESLHNQSCLYAIANDDAELQYAALVIVLTALFRSNSNMCGSSKQS